MALGETSIVARLILNVEARGLEKFAAVETGLKTVGAEADTMGGMMAKGAGLAALGIAGAATAVVGFGLVSNMHFQAAMDKVHGFAGQSAEDMKYYEESIKHVSTSLGTSATDMANGLYYVVSAGFKGKEAMDVLKNSTMAAAASDSSFASVADAVTTALNAYHLSGSQAGRVTDELSKTVVLGKTTFDELARSIGRPLSIAPLLGASLADVGGAMATLTNHGFSARLAGMQLTTMMRGMLAPSAGMQKEATALGASWEDLYNVKGHGFEGTLRRINDLALKNAHSHSQYAENLKALLGNAAALQAFLAMAGDGFKTLHQNIDGVNHSTGTTANAFKLHMDTMAGKAKQFEVAVQNMAMAITEPLIPVVSALLGKLTELASYVTSNWPAVEAAMQRFHEATKSAFNDAGTAVGGFMAKLGSLKDAFFGFDTVINTHTPHIHNLTLAMKQHGATQEDVTPKVIHHRGALQELSDAMGRATNNGHDLARSIGDIKSSLSDIGGSIDKITTDISKLGLHTTSAHEKGKSWADFLAGAFTLVVDGIKSQIQGLALAMEGIAKAFDVSVKIGDALSKVSSVINTVFGAIEKVIGAAMKAIGDAVNRGFGDMVSQSDHHLSAMHTMSVRHMTDMRSESVAQMTAMNHDVVRELTSMADRVVGHSIIPDMQRASVREMVTMQTQSVAAMQTMKTQSVAAMQAMATAIGAILSALAGQAYSWGAAMGSQFAAGIASQAGAVSAAAAALGNAAKAGMKPGSPPRDNPWWDMFAWGKRHAELFAEGMVSGAFAVSAAASALGAASMPKSLGGGADSNATAAANGVGSAGYTHGDVANAASGLAGPMAQLTAAMQALPAEFSAAGMKIADAMQTKITAAYDNYLKKLQAENADFHKKLKEEHDKYLKQLKDNNDGYVSIMAKENQRHATAMQTIHDRSNEQLNHYLIDHNIRITAQHQQQLLAAQKNEASYLSARQKILDQLAHVHGKHAAEQAARLQKSLADLDALHKRYNDTLAASLGIKNKEQRALLDEWLRHHAWNLDEALKKENAIHDGHVKAINDAHTKHAQKIKEIHDKHVQGIKDTHEKHVKAITDAFNKAIGTLKTELMKAMTPEGIFAGLKAAADQLAKDAMAKLRLAILTGQGDINDLAKASAAAALEAKKYADAEKLATEATDRAAGDFTSSVSAMKSKVDGALQNAIDKYTYDLINHTGNLAEDSIAILQAKKAVEDFNAAVASATSVADSFAQAIAVASGSIVGLYDANVKLADTQYKSALAAYENAKVAGVTGDALAALRQQAIDAGIALKDLQAIPSDIQNAINAERKQESVGTFAQQQTAAQTKAKDALDLLAMAIMTGTGDVAQLASDAKAAADGSEKYTLALKKATEMLGSTALTFALQQTAAQNKAKDALDKLALALMTGQGDVTQLAADAAAAAAGSAAFTKALADANAMIAQTNQSFQQLQASANTAATQALDALALGIMQGSASISVLTANAIAAAQNAKLFADAMKQAQQVVNDVVNPAKAQSPLQQAQTAYDAALKKYQDDVLDGAPKDQQQQDLLTAQEDYKALQAIQKILADTLAAVQQGVTNQQQAQQYQIDQLKRLVAMSEEAVFIQNTESGHNFQDWLNGRGRLASKG